MADGPDKEWWTAAELAEAGLPDVPTTKRRVNAMANREGWAKMPGKVRRRKGAGGGMAYHWTVLPLRARTKLGVRLSRDRNEPSTRTREETWALFETASASAQTKARGRLQALIAVSDLETALPTRSDAVQAVADDRKLSSRSIWNWIERVGFRKLGYEPGEDTAGLLQTSVVAFQADHDLVQDGLVGRATLSTLQRMLDARTKIAAPVATAGAGATVEATDLPDAAPDLASLPDWIGWVVLGLGLLWLAWRLWSYRDAVAARVQSFAPRLANILRSF
ncbi:Mu DNA-binding domain protein [Marinibacterium anthonyi]|nr:Mu DNA-binding domain protein [Marinibacterium anthonyi]